jgi:hypothetical protein
MADWKDAGKSYKYTGSYGYSPNTNVLLTLQYDAESITTTSVKLRFKTTGPNTSNYFYVLWNPGAGEGKEKLYCVKNTEYKNPEFSLTKTASSETFSIPALWICCTGVGNVPTSDYRYNINYSDWGPGSMYKCFGEKRTTWRTTFTSSTTDLNSKALVAGGKPTCSISQTPGSNTVTFSGKTGKAGTNNAVKTSGTSKGSYLWYTTNGQDPTLATSTRTCVSLGTSSDSDYTHSINISANRSVKAFVITYFTHNNASSSTAGKSCLYYSAGGKPTCAVIDNGNNTFTISGKLGKSGDNNALIGARLYYTTNGKDPDTSGEKKNNTKEVALGNTSEAAYSKVYAITSNTTVKAVVGCQFTYAVGGASKVTAAANSGSITYYNNSGNPGKPVIEYTKSRLTLKEDWTIKWGAASAGSTDIAGYYIRLLVDGNSIPFVNKNNVTLTSTSSSADAANKYYYDRSIASLNGDYDTTSLVFRTSNNLSYLAVGKKVKVKVIAYTVNGAGTKLFSEEVVSDEYPIENAGIVYAKVNGQWKEGQVYTKVNGTWVEAETVNVKVSGSWEESQ